MNQSIFCIFPSGRIIDRTVLGEERVEVLAAEMPTLNYFFARRSDVTLSERPHDG